MEEQAYCILHNQVYNRKDGCDECEPKYDDDDENYTRFGEDDFLLK